MAADVPVNAAALAPGVFINYRREDTGGYAGRLYGDLGDALGRDRVFMDVEGYAAGADFVEVIGDSVRRAGVVLVLIGPAWVDARTTDGRRRLDDPDDLVRVEIEAALSCSAKVIPLLFGSVRMPPPETLPESLRSLSRRNALEVSDSRWRFDVGRVLIAIRGGPRSGSDSSPATAPGDRVMRDLPSGTVTFLFTDIEGSTRLLDELGARYADLLAEHHRVLRAAIAAHGGVEVDTEGDAFFVAFSRASDALVAASAAQAGLAEMTEGRVRVRMGIHTGQPQRTDEGYVGMDVHQAARIGAAAHGGQIVVSEQTATLLGPGMPGLKDLGRHRLKDLTEAVHLYQAGFAEHPALRSLNATNLPVQPTVLVGREAEVAAVTGLVRDHRVVTLTGPGGVGKTRLALQVAAEVTEQFEDGVTWVPLSGVAEPQLVMPTLDAGIGGRGDPAASIGERHMLLLLDNLEQVIDSAPALAELLRSCARLHLLVTSRAPMRIAGERDYAVQPLAVADGVALFRQAAGLNPDEEDDRTLAEICRRVDGLPLAIELAAARARALSPAAILQRLEKRLGLLTGGGRDLPDRQRTLRATIEWSVDLLPSGARDLFARLGVFVGGFDLEAAEAVADADLDVLSLLVDHSLVRHEGERYRMLDTIHELASEQLAASEDATAMSERHARHFAGMARQAVAEDGRMVESDKWLERLRTEHTNFRAALESLAAAHAGGALLDIVEAHYVLWGMAGALNEGQRWSSAALDESPDADPEQRAWIMLVRSNFSRFADENVRAARFLTECLDQAREHGLERIEAAALHDLGSIHAAAGDFAAARACHERALEIRRRIGDPRGIAHALDGFSELEMFAGNLAEADRIMGESAEYMRAAGLPPVMTMELLGSHAEVKRRLGDRRAAETMFRKLLEGSRRARFHAGFTQAILGVAALRAGTDPRRAAVLIGGEQAQRRVTGQGPWDAVEYERLVALLEEELGPDAYREALAEGARLDDEQLVALALAPTVEDIVQPEAADDDLVAGLA